jgi:hypothetical protein
MSASLPHYKMGPANKQVSTLIYGGQMVQPTTLTAGTTDLTVALALSGSVNVMGVAGNDANVLTAQTGSPNSYGQPLIDISVLTDYTSVYFGGVDTWVWYTNQGNVTEGARLIIGGTSGCVTVAGATPDARTVVGICTHPGGVSTAMCTQAIGGQGSATFFFGRARVL